MSELATSFPLLLLRHPHHIQGDTPCLRCAYNLRTLHISAVCPECSTPVAATIYARDFRYASPKWLLGLTVGCACLFMMPIAVILTALAISLLKVQTPIALFVLLPPLSAFAAGMYFLTRPDTMFEKYSPRPNRTRNLLFYASACAIAYLIIAACFAHALPRHPGTALGAIIEPRAAILCGTSFFAALITRHLANLMNRGASFGIRVLCHTGFWLSFVCLAAILFYLAGGLLFHARPPELFIEHTVPCVMLAVISAYCVIFLTGLVFLAARRKSVRAHRQYTPPQPQNDTPITG